MEKPLNFENVKKNCLILTFLEVAAALIKKLKISWNYGLIGDWYFYNNQRKGLETGLYFVFFVAYSRKKIFKSNFSYNI